MSCDVQGPRGSEGFFAPEMLFKGAFDPMKSDIWSFGCVLHELLLGQKDFVDRWMIHFSHLLSRDASDMHRVDDFIEGKCVCGTVVSSDEMYYIY